MAKRARTALYVAAASIAALVIAAAVWRFQPRHTPEGQPPLATLSAGGVELKSAFNAAAGSPRVLVLLSPT
jgi:hypothetical protein